MNLKTNANTNGSMPIAQMGVESKQQPEVKKYTVPITVKIEMDLSGDVPVAVDADEALAKVQLAIDTKTLDQQIELQDGLTLFTISYGDVTGLFGSVVGIADGEQAVEA